jgi:DNA polymerase II large subunit
MKYLCVAVLSVGLGSVSVSCVAGETRADHARGRVLKDCDPVCELKSQDKAFALLIEAYRQLQSHQIQSDYEQRMRSAAALGEQGGSLIIQTKLEGVQQLRFFVEALARKERELRMEQLQTQVTNFHTAYGCMRRVDEEDAGEPVAKQVDTKVAATKLNSFSIVALGSPATANYKVVKSVPSSTIFLDAPPVQVPLERLVEPCD